MWLLPLWFVPIQIALSLAPKKILSYFLAAGLVTVNLTGLGINYFLPILKTGGVAMERVYVGGRYDNSWDYVDFMPLAKKFSEIPFKAIYVEDFNTFRLEFLLPPFQNRRVTFYEVVTIGSQKLITGPACCFG